MAKQDNTKEIHDESKEKILYPELTACQEAIQEKRCPVRDGHEGDSCETCPYSNF